MNISSTENTGSVTNSSYEHIYITAPLIAIFQVFRRMFYIKYVSKSNASIINFRLKNIINIKGRTT
jgi:hypothetical protein